MAGLDDIDPTHPAGTESPTLIAQYQRALADKVIAAFEVEHYLAGEHKIGVGPLASRPAAGHKGRFWVITATGVEDELQYDDGAAWQYLTSNQDMIAAIASLAVHRAATPIDHPDNSVTAVKIPAGAILLRHLVPGSTDPASIAALVQAGSADALHTHPRYLTAADFNFIEPSNLSPMIVGPTLLGTASTGRAVTGFSYYEKYKEIKLLRPGDITVHFTVTADSGSIFAQIYRNDMPVGTERVSSGTGGGWYEDITGNNIDDLIQLYAYYDPMCVNPMITAFEIYAGWDMVTIVD